MNKAKEHPFKTVSKMIKDGSWPSVVLLYGKERFLVDWAVKAISDSVLNPVTKEMDMAVFAEKEDSIAEIIAACETVPFMSQKKVVIIKDIGIDSSEEFTDYLSNVPESTLIIISLDKPDKRKAFYKKVEKTGLAYDFGELDEASLVSWVNKRFAAKGKSISRNDIIRFAGDAGYFDKDKNYGLYNFENDIRKVLAYYDKTEISCEDMERLCILEDDDNAFKLLDAAFSGDKDKALKLFNASVRNEMPSRQISAILQFHGLLCSQLELMLEARQRREKGQTMAQIEEETGIHPFRLKKAIEASERLNTARLKAALAGCYRIETEIKKGRSNPRLALELFIAKI